ncbi:DUF1385 domain-containing protein [Proteinivorax hydrogeniformans]|uniref:DUF1385 domain-containing protein n=1 Tax=Proteinivorax hydrogeniformans TaxID=1826727 RepID=A0AAU8HTN9_9FIRM
MSEKHNFAVGGQALMEGVLFRGAEKTAIAVRKPDGEVFLKSFTQRPLTKKNKIYGIPIIRGAVTLFDALKTGMKMLALSADISEGQEEKSLSKKELGFTMVTAILFSVLLFFVLPTLLSGLVTGGEQSNIYNNLIEGLFRLIIFLGYVLIISRLKEINRFFQYHGAEHMVIHCYEADEELNVENAKKMTTLHPRCGTAFMLLVMVISILFFSLFPWGSMLSRVAIRILAVPLLAGIAYEANRLAYKTSLLKPLLLPGLWLQLLTTKKPDDRQLEVAILSFKAALGEEE